MTKASGRQRRRVATYRRGFKEGSQKSEKLLDICQRLIKWDTDFPVNGWNGYAGLKELDKIIADAKVAVHSAGASYDDEFGTNQPANKEERAL